VAFCHLAVEPSRHFKKTKSPRRNGAGIFAVTIELFIFVKFARVLPVVLFSVVLARLAGVGNGLMTLARERGSTKWQ
jgi:hypothetical protein